ncbi:MAG TPA: M14 family metallopeptidase [Solirubrobacteraceae bacterium]|jgi:hypothetical protein
MTSRIRIAALPAAAIILALGASSALAAAPSLPPVERTLTTATKGGSARTTYRAPMSGFVTVRLHARRGDWDLVLADAASKRRLASSAGFGASEVAQTWVQAGQRIAVRGVRNRGAKRARVSIRFLDVAPPKSGAASLVRVANPTKLLLETLEHEGFDVTHNVRKGRADVLVPDQSHMSLLTRLGAKFEVIERDMGAYFRRARLADRAYAERVAKSPLPSGRTGYRQYADYQAELKQLVADHPSVVRPVVIGESFQGREIQGVEISDDVNREDDGKPVFFLMGVHHAREWPSGEIAMEFAYLLANGHGADPEISRLLDKQRVVIVPLINPDGFVASRAAAEDGMFPDPADTTGIPNADTVEGVAVPFGGNLAYRRKNCNGPVSSFEGEKDYPCYYQWGVDPNRNYGEGWGGPGASPDPNTQVYRGAGQWSEPETQAVHQYSQTHAVTNLISLHTVAALVLRPPGIHTKGRIPDEHRMRALGKQMADATGYTNQFGFQLYDTSGTTEDWNYAAAGTFGYTIEIGPLNGPFHGPYEEGVVNEWEGSGAGGMKEALLVNARSAATDEDHSVLTGEAAPGTVLRLKKEFDTESADVCVFAQGYVRAGTVPPLDCIGAAGKRIAADGLDYTTVVPSNGRFEWHVTPSTRPFVGGKYIEGDITDRTETFEGPGVPKPQAARERREFVVRAEDGTTDMDLHLDVKGEDYNLYLKHVEPDGSEKPIGEGQLIDGVLVWTAPGTGVNYPTMNEHIIVENPPPGRYIAEVESRAGVKNDWTLTVDLKGQKDGHAVSTGQTEAYTLTCETREGTVLGSSEVVVNRGERKPLDLPDGCGGAPPATADDAQPPLSNAPSPPAPSARATKAKPRAVRVSVKPRRDRRRPYRFTVTGRVVPPNGLSAASACAGGRAAVTLKAGKRNVARRVVKLRGCSFKVRVTSRKRARKLRVGVRFLGSDGLEAASARQLTVRAG